MINAYEILGVRFDATDEEIKTAFRRKAMRDCGRDGNRKVENGDYYLDIILKARDTLLNKRKRKKLDKYLSRQKNASSQLQVWQSTSLSTDVMYSFLDEKTTTEKINTIAQILNPEGELEENVPITHIQYPKMKLELKIEPEETEYISLKNLYGLLFSDNTFAFYYQIERRQSGKGLALVPEDRRYLINSLTSQELSILDDYNSLYRWNSRIPWEEDYFIRTDYSQLAHAFPAYSLIPVSMIKDQKISLCQLKNLQMWIQLLLSKNPNFAKSLFKEELAKLDEKILEEQQAIPYVRENILCKPGNIITSLIPEVFEKYQKLNPSAKMKLSKDYNLQHIQVVIGKEKSIHFAEEDNVRSIYDVFDEGEYRREQYTKRIYTLRDVFTGQRFWQRKEIQSYDLDWTTKALPWSPGQVFYDKDHEYTAFPLYKLVPPTKIDNVRITTDDLRSLYNITSDYLRNKPELIENLFGKEAVKQKIKR